MDYNPNKPESVEFFKGILFENEYKFLKRQVTEFFKVTERTIEHCLERNEKELSKNGYVVHNGKRLTDLKLVESKVSGNEINFTTKTIVLGVFNCVFFEEWHPVINRPSQMSDLLVNENSMILTIV